MLPCLFVVGTLEVALDASIGQLPETFELFTYVVVVVVRVRSATANQAGLATLFSLAARRL